jgi:hypothetical protein
MGQHILCVGKKVTWKFKISSWKTRIDQLMGSVEKAIIIRHFNSLTNLLLLQFWGNSL